MKSIKFLSKTILILVFVFFTQDTTAQNLHYARDKACDCYGYVDDQGNLVIPYRYASANKFSEGLAAVWLNKKWGFIDEKGNQVIPLQFEYVKEFSNGLAAVIPLGKEEFGFINKKGVMVIPAKYKFVYSFNDNGIATVSTATRSNFQIDKTGKEITNESVKSNSNIATKNANSKYESLKLKTPLEQCTLAAEQLQNPSTVNVAVKTLKKYEVNDNLAIAAYYLAGGFEKGLIHSPKKEIDSALYYYEKAAVKGYDPAMYSLARLYQYANGKDYPTTAANNPYAKLIDNKKALYWYQEYAKKHGNELLNIKINALDQSLKAEALANSDDYSKGYDAYQAKNYQDAHRYWLIAAEQQNDAAAYYGLGILHEMQVAPGANYSSAIQYFQKAADLGMKQALVEVQNIQNYFDALIAAKNRKDEAAVANESYEKWWQKTYGRGGTQNSTAMPNNNIPQATFKSTQSEADRHSREMDKQYRDLEKIKNGTWNGH